MKTKLFVICLFLVGCDIPNWGVHATFANLKEGDLFLQEVPESWPQYIDSDKNYGQYIRSVSELEGIPESHLKGLKLFFRNVSTSTKLESCQDSEFGDSESTNDIELLIFPVTLSCTYSNGIGEVVFNVKLNYYKGEWSLRGYNYSSEGFRKLFSTAVENVLNEHLEKSIIRLIFDNKFTRDKGSIAFNEEFGGVIVVTPDSEWKNRLNKSISDISDIPELKVLKLGDKVHILTFFENPMVNSDGFAKVVCDYRIVRPDHTLAVHGKDMTCLEGVLEDKKTRYWVSPQIPYLLADENEPDGEYEVVVSVTDNSRTLNLRTSFILDKGL